MTTKRPRTVLSFGAGAMGPSPTPRTMPIVHERQLARGPNGRHLCRYCQKEVTPPRRTFCSEKCVKAHQIEHSPSAMRYAVAERDRYICARCGVDAQTLRVKRDHPWRDDHNAQGRSGYRNGANDPQPMNVDHRLIVLARESRGVTQIDLAERLGMSQGRLSRIEDGLVPITEEGLGKIATALSYPPEKFLADEPLYGTPITELFHRKRASVPQRILKMVYAALEFRRMEIARLLASVNLESPLPMPRLEPDEYDEDIPRIAQLVRAQWRIPRGPIPNVTALIEAAGGIVVETDFGTDKIDAISTWVPGMPPLFFVNPNVPTDRLRYSLSHELGHTVMHVVPRPSVETEADQFAAEFLMPADEIRTSLSKIRLPELATLKRYWKVSMNALLFRASELECIDFYQKDHLWRQMSKMGFRTREPAETDLPREDPRLLRELVSTRRNGLMYTTGDLARVVRLSEEESAALYHNAGTGRLRLIK